LEQLYSAAQQAQAAAGGAAPDVDVEAPEAASSEPRQAKGKVVEAEVVDK
jgi:molecular chaperone DnaK